MNNIAKNIVIAVAPAALIAMSVSAPGLTTRVAPGGNAKMPGTRSDTPKPSSSPSISPTPTPTPTPPQEKLQEAIQGFRL